MIPIKLTLQGLFSYQEKQTIDFQRLTEAHLFGVFGSVGCGKSSILDAITYALYGETERMNARDNRNYNMMNLKSDELFVEFDFMVGKTLYRAAFRGKRNRKNFGEVKTLDRTVYKKEKDTWEPFDVSQIPAIIGLSYENFKRTIIIPQGKFQEFLQLGNKDRTQMMKELFNLEKFELWYKTIAIENKNKEQLQNLEGKLQQLGEVKPEQLEVIKTQKITLDAEIKQVNQQLAEKQNNENKLKHLQELVVKMKEQQNRHQQLHSRVGEVEKSEQRLKEYEYCRNNFKNLFERTDELEKEVTRLKKVIEVENRIQQNSMHELSTLSLLFEKLKIEYSQRDQMILQATELKSINQIVTLNEKNQIFSDRIKKGEKSYQDLSEEVKRVKSDHDKSLDLLKTLKLKLPNINELAKAHHWFTIRKSSNNIDWQIGEEIKTIKNEIKNLEANVLNQTTGYQSAETAFFQSRSQWLEYFSKLEHLIKEEISTITNQIEHLLVREKLEDYAAGLENGKPCPLCGSISHPEILVGGEAKISIQKERAQKELKEKEFSAIEKLMSEIMLIGTQIELKQESIEKLKNKQKENQKAITAHQSLFVWPEWENEQVVDQLMKEAESISESIKNEESNQEKLRIQLEKGEKNLELYAKELDKIREKQTINQSEVTTLSRQIEILKIDVYLKKPIDEINQLYESQLIKIKDLESAYQKSTDKIVILQQQQKESFGKLQANGQMLDQALKTREMVRQQIDHLLLSSNYSSIETVKTILSWHPDIDAERKMIQTFRDQLQLCASQIKILTAEMGEQVYSDVAHQQLTEEIVALKKFQSEKNQALGKMEGEIRQLIRDLEVQAEIQKELARLRLRSDNLGTLKKLFKGSGFVNYVSSVHLENLCLAANDRFFKLVRQKMSLEITDDNNFQVRDFMNGGKIRSVKTLSGGQTFQAALSLALALADSIQHYSDSSQNFFFLDEGFGALDKEALEVVFDTLKSLRKENRIVGVISHVEEMQQEIDTHLRIVNHEDTGSRISCSWDRE